MTPDDVYKFYGGPAKAARELGFSRSLISMWKLRGFIPADKQARIQKSTGGKLRARIRDVRGGKR